MRYQKARRWLIFWCLFIGLGAVAGAIGMLSDPSGQAMGMAPMLPYFQVLPFADVLFQDFTFAGMALLVVNGLTNLTAAWLLLRKKHVGVVLGGVFGVTLMLWICIQFYMFECNFMSSAYFVFGAAQAATGYACLVFEKQEAFAARPLPTVAPREDADALVAYFSRMGYARMVAVDAALAGNADLHEITTSEKTSGTAGFWWCGRFAMHRWDMPLTDREPNYAQYARVTLVTPVWAFALCAPMRAFCRRAAGKLREDCVVEYVAVHHNKSCPKAVFDEMDALLGAKAASRRSVQIRQGRVLSDVTIK